MLTLVSELQSEINRKRQGLPRSRNCVTFFQMGLESLFY